MCKQYTHYIIISLCIYVYHSHFSYLMHSKQIYLHHYVNTINGPHTLQRMQNLLLKFLILGIERKTFMNF